VFDEASDLFKIGMCNQLQAVMTRDDTMVSGFAYYDSNLSKLVNRSLTTSDIGSGTLNVAQGGTGSNTLTANKILVGNSSNPVNTPTELHWDNVNKRLGVNTSAPSTTLDIAGSMIVQSNATLSNVTASNITTSMVTASNVVISLDTSNAPGISWSGDRFSGIYRSASNVFNVVAHGGVELAKFSSNATFGARMLPPTMSTSNLTDTGVVYTYTTSAPSTLPLVFDNDISTIWEPTDGGYGAGGSWDGTLTNVFTNVAGSNIPGHWIQIQSSVPFAANGILLYPKPVSGFNPKATYVVGSSNGSNWAMISSFADINLETARFNFRSINSNATPYTHYRIIFNSTKGAGNVALATLNYVSSSIYTTSKGSIGIGTPSPAYTFDIAGTLRATGTSTFNDVVVTSLSAPAVTMSNIVASNLTSTVAAVSNLTVGTSLTGSNASLCNITVSSSLTGNQAALSNLTVASTLVSTSALSANNLSVTSLTGNAATISNLTVTTNVTGNTASVSNLTVATGATLASITGNGATLSNLTVASTLNTNTASVSNLTVVTGATLASITGNGATLSNLTVASTLNTNTASVSNLTVVTAATLASITGNGATLSNLTVASTLTSSSVLNANTASVSNLTVATGATLASITGNGATLSNLTVASTLTSSSVLNANGAYVTSLVGNTASVSNLTVSSNVTGNTAVFSNVTAPAATLTSINTSLIAASNVQLAALGTSNSPSISWANNTGTGMYLVSSNVLGFAANQQQRMVITSSNIGIGTSTPSYALDVLGTVNATNVLINGQAVTATGGGSSSNITASNNDSTQITLQQNSRAGKAGVKLVNASNNNFVMNYDVNNTFNLLNGTTTSPVAQQALSNSLGTASTISVPSINWNSLAYSPELGVFSAVGLIQASNILYSTDGGYTWTQSVGASDPLYGNIWASNPGIFVGCGEKQRIIRGSNGFSNWASFTLGESRNSTFETVSWSPELRLFVVAGNAASPGTSNLLNTATIVTSSNAVTWTSQQVLACSNIKSMCWSPALGLFTGVGKESVITSSNGTAWNIYTLSNNLAKSWTSVTWSPELGLFAAVASDRDSNCVMTSSNGVSWISRTCPSTFSNAWRTISWNPQWRVFVALGNNGSNNPIMMSADGITWAQQVPSPSGNWSSIVWAADISTYVAIANGSVMRTTLALPTQLAIDDTGYVGIGTSNPSYPLDVTGTARIVNVISDNVTTSNITIGSSLVGNSATVSNLTVASTLTSSTTLMANTLTASNLTASTLTSSNVTTSNITGNNGTLSNLTVASNLSGLGAAFSNMTVATLLTSTAVTVSNLTVATNLVGNGGSLSNLTVVNTLTSSSMFNANSVNASNLTFGTSLTGSNAGLSNLTVGVNLTGSNAGVSNLTVASTFNASVANASNLTVGVNLTGSNAGLSNLTVSSTFNANTANASNLTIGNSATVNSNLTVTAILTSSSTLRANALTASNMTTPTITTSNVATSNITATVITGSNIGASNLTVASTFNTSVANASNLTVGANLTGSNAGLSNLTIASTLNASVANASNLTVGVNLTGSNAGVSNLTVASTFNTSVANASNLTVGANLTGSNAGLSNLTIASTITGNTITASNMTVSSEFTGNTITVSNITTTSVYTRSNDSASTPAYSWVGDTNTGMFHYGEGAIGFSSNGSTSIVIGQSNYVLDVQGGVRTQASVMLRTSNATDIGLAMNNTSNNTVSIVYNPSNDLSVVNRIDGVNVWTPKVIGNAWVNTVCWSPTLGYFVAMTGSTAGNTVHWSSNGRDWAGDTSAMLDRYHAVAWIPESNIYLAVGRRTVVASSSSPSNWTTKGYMSASMTTNDFLWDVCWSPQQRLAVAVGHNTSNNIGRIAYSSNPAFSNAWIVNSNVGSNIWGVCWSPELGKYVAVGNSNAYVSSNGVSWSTRTIPSAQIWRSVAWSPQLSLFVAVSSSGLSNGIMTSSNGDSWTLQTGPASLWTSVTWAAERSSFWAVASNSSPSIAASKDGITWTPYNAVSEPWTDICWAPELDMFVAVANQSGQTSNVVMYTNITSNVTNVTLDGQTGFVGIGTTTPSATLHGRKSK
jgi:hypothetical protein